MSQLLTVREVAEITQLHEMTIRRYIQAGKLEAVRVGRRIRVPSDALTQLFSPARPAQPSLSEERTGEPTQLRESSVVYGVQSSASQRSAQGAIGAIALQLSRLPAEDVSLVARMVESLQQGRQPAGKPIISGPELAARAKERASLLEGMPRAEMAARLGALIEEIRQHALASGTALEGDWTGD